MRQIARFFYLFVSNSKKYLAMKKIVLTFGIIAGVIVSVMMFVTFYEGFIDIEHGELLGYSTMIIAFSVIFFGIRAHRDKHLGGTIKFGKAFLIGLYITLIASTMYVASWMTISNTYGKDFMDQYYAKSIEELRQSDQTEEEIEAQIQDMKEFQEMYKNPAVKIGVTYTEILPVGLLISLICAAILKRNKAVPVER
jgi:hypothetical protein